MIYIWFYLLLKCFCLTLYEMWHFGQVMGQKMEGFKPGGHINIFSHSNSTWRISIITLSKLSVVISVKYNILGNFGGFPALSKLSVVISVKYNILGNFGGFPALSKVSVVISVKYNILGNYGGFPALSKLSVVISVKYNILGNFGGFPAPINV